MDRRFCDACSKDTTIGSYVITIGMGGLFSKKIVNATVCSECANKTLEFLRSLKNQPKP